MLLWRRPDVWHRRHLATSWLSPRALMINATCVIMHHGSRRFCILMLHMGTIVPHASGPSIASNCWKLLGQMRWHRLRPPACGKMWPPSSQGILHKVAMEMDDLFHLHPQHVLVRFPLSILFRDHASRAWTRPTLHLVGSASRWYHGIILRIFGELYVDTWRGRDL